MGRPKVKFIDDSEPVENSSSVILNEAERSEESLPVRQAGPTNVGLKHQPKADRPLDEVERSFAEAQDDKNTKPKKPGKAKPRSKKYKEVSKDLDKSLGYPIEEAIELVKKTSYSKFTGSLEAHINTTQTGIRGLVSLPFASGKKLVILAFGEGADQSGADVIGTDEVIEEISKGRINFDLVVTTPAWMHKLSKIAKFLGPRGLMPNPKNGTITTDLKKAVEGFQSGKTEYKTEAKSPVLHINLGKLDQPTEELTANAKTLLLALGKSRIKKVKLAPTMGPSVKINYSSK